MLTSQIIEQDDNSITIQYTNKKNENFNMTVFKAPGFTVEQLLERWTRRGRLEYMRNPVIFYKFIDRINNRHQKILSGEIEPVLPQPAPAPETESTPDPDPTPTSE
jgi:hypothetical protein